jgi:hypothetical protein
MGYSEQTENRIRKATEKAKKKREEEYRLSQEGVPAMTYDEVVESVRNPDPNKKEGPSLFLDIDEEAAIRDRIGGKAVAKADAERDAFNKADAARTDTQSLGDRERWDKGDARIEEEENEAELQTELEGLEIEPVDEKELREQRKTARFASVGEAAFDELGDDEGAVPGETYEEKEARIQADIEKSGGEFDEEMGGRDAERARLEAEGQEDVERQIGQDQATHEERVKNNLYTNNPKDARHIEELEYREDRLRQLGSGKSRGEIAAANNPVWQQALAEKEAREAAELSIEEKAGIANKKTTAMDEAMRDAGHEVDRGITPTFINPDTGKEEGGAHYKPSIHDVINVTDDAGNIVGQKVVRKKGAPEDPDKPSPEEMKSRRDAYENKIREEGIAQKAERKRRGMIKTGDVHGLKELDRQTAEDAATRVRDAEAAILADQTKSQRQKEIAIQKLKNKGTTDVEDIRAGAQTGVATTAAGAQVDVATLTTESAEAMNTATNDATQLRLTTTIEAEENTAEALAVTNAATASAQAKVDEAAAAVENAQTSKEREAKEKHLQLMQAGLLTAEEKRQKAQIAADKASEEREIAERERSQTSAQEATASEGEAQGQRDQALLDARNNSPEAVDARRKAAKKEAAENRAINQAILDDKSSTPGEQDAAQRAIRDANRVLTGDDGSTEPNQIPVEESEEYLQNANPMTYEHTMNVLVSVDDDDGDETTNNLAGSNTDSLNKFVVEIRKNIKNGNIDVDELDSVGNILLSRMDPTVRESYERLIRVRDGEDDRHVIGGMDSAAQQEEMQNRYDQADDTVTYLEQLFRGENPTNVAPFVPATAAAIEAERAAERSLEGTPSPWMN